MSHSKHRKVKARRKKVRSLAGPAYPARPVEIRKMSEILLEFIEPYLERASQVGGLKKLVTLGAFAWNMGLLPDPKRADVLKELEATWFQNKRPSLLGKLGDLAHRLMGVEEGSEPEEKLPEVAGFRQLVHELVERKLGRFGHNRRLIVSFDFKETEEDMDLVVMSTLDIPEQV